MIRKNDEQGKESWDYYFLAGIESLHWLFHFTLDIR